MANKSELNQYWMNFLTRFPVGFLNWSQQNIYVSENEIFWKRTGIDILLQNSRFFVKIQIKLQNIIIFWDMSQIENTETGWI